MVSIPGVDYSFSKPDPKQLASLGYKFAALYIGAGTEDKQLHPAERDALWAAGLDIVLLCEAYANSALQGYNEGARQANLCISDFTELNVPSYVPVYFAADEDLVSAGDFSTIDAFCHGAADVIGVNRVGMYGEYDLMVYLSKNSKYCKWFFQTYAWSHQLWFAGNHFEQYQNNVNLAGGNVDLCRAKQLNFGQWSKDKKITEIEMIMTHCSENGGYYSYPYPKWYKSEAAVTEALTAYGMTRDNIREYKTLDAIRAAFGTIPGVDVPADNFGNMTVSSSPTPPKPIQPSSFTINLTGTATPDD